MDQAFRLLTSMTDKKLEPTTYTFELVISTLAKKLQWRRCLQLLDLMEECNRYANRAALNHMSFSSLN